MKILFLTTLFFVISVAYTLKAQELIQELQTPVQNNGKLERMEDSQKKSNIKLQKKVTIAEINATDKVPANTEKPDFKTKKFEAKEKQPLYIVDGKEISEDSFIKNVKAENIEQVETLKGESAIKAYGEKGKNGAIVITTKKK